uniref:Dynein regulatory complex subunit 3 n=1 Tax=Cynoglossus semilaevis TaxID=244447 RepID=A0A3P8WD61_CYNSE
MSGHFEDSEPVLMNDEILRKAIDEQTSQDQTERTAKAGGLPFNEVYKIRLEYKNILMISHLKDLTSLTRLDLNNNMIERIEGVDHLRNLTWLNLSFNRIKKIEGLDSLTKLELLNLTDNKISAIENMDSLQKLTNFGIANNLIPQLENVIYLRKLKNLLTLNLYGNPISEEKDYTLFIAAHFPHLMHLDYRLLDDTTKNEASMKYHCVIEEMRLEEQQKQQKEDAEKSLEAELQLHKVIQKSGLIMQFVLLTYDFAKISLDLTLTFEEQMVELCMQLFQTGLAEHQQREAEVNLFLSAQTQAVTEYQQKASQTLMEFESKHKKLQQVSDPDSLQIKISCHSDEINQLCNTLMSMEFQLVSQLEETIKKLEISISEMVGNFTEFVQGIYPFDNYYRKVKDIAAETLKKVATEGQHENIPKEVRRLFTDKDAVMDALATAHDNHLQKINDRETQLVTRVDAWRVGLIKEIQDKELQRNRTCVLDIHKYTDYSQDQLEEFLLKDYRHEVCLR